LGNLEEALGMPLPAVEESYLLGLREGKLKDLWETVAR
ncbi:MAG: hypothetical protein H6Q00_379, partial [Holophagaceae bacterium]|nr:hypothetical protein [Holophagaceae bacterium]